MFRCLLNVRTRLSGSACAHSGHVASALDSQCSLYPSAPQSEPLQEHLAGTHARALLGHELTALCRNPDTVPVVVGAEHCASGDCRTQPMPFDHRRVAAYFHHAWPETVARAIDSAVCRQRSWERAPLDDRYAVFERAADLLAGEHRQRVIAAAMLGQGMTAIQAERDLCLLIDHLRIGCYYARELTRSRCVIEGGLISRNANQYHGLEGFWAAITPCDSFAVSSLLAVAPALMGNGVVWKPSDHAVLACHSVFECLECAGLPPGVVNFVPAEENAFLDAVASSEFLAGVSFSGTTRTLEHIWRTVGANVGRYDRFPRVVGTGGGKNFHVVHSSADLATAVACTARAAFESAGQRSTSCSRVFVADSVAERFIEALACVVQSLMVCHPLDYRCFLSALASRDAFDKVSGYLERGLCDESVQLVCGGRADPEVGYYVEPTMFLVGDPCHELLRDEIRGPVLAVHRFPDCELEGLVWTMSQAPYALTGSIFAQDVQWSRWAVGALRDLSASLCVNERCAEERPGHQSTGGARKSGTGAKAGSISYLLQFSTERSLKEMLQTCSDVTYAYMDECPPCYVFK